MVIEAPAIFVRIYARHGHRCPMSTLGGRLGLAARQALGVDPGPLRAIYGSRTCALDGIAETTGCGEADGHLRVANDGRHALTLRSADNAVGFELTTTALEMAGRYRSLCNRLEQGWDDLPGEEQERRRAAMEAMLDELLPQFWQAADEVLVRKVEPFICPIPS